MIVQQLLIDSVDLRSGNEVIMIETGSCTNERELCTIAKEDLLGIHHMINGNKEGKVFVLILSMEVDPLMEAGTQGKLSRGTSVTMVPTNVIKWTQREVPWMFPEIGWELKDPHQDLVLSGERLTIDHCTNQGKVPGGRLKRPNDWMEKCLEIQNKIRSEGTEQEVLKHWKDKF
mmetsp:Transcript_46604/g.146112  ORF Transcript_46604/g.146112 Transcript_46604/m.146112 type:complete len:174 (+) Transcript_46604:793-1314(+)